MGRPLKIKNTLTTDIGFNAFNQLTDPVIPGGMNATQHLGVVGGGFPGGVATPAYPTVECSAYFTDGSGELPAYIITQKGATKYLVAANNAIADGSFIIGQSYTIKVVGNTNWTAIGAGTNPQIGDVFTATSVGGAGTGTAASTAVCILVNLGQGNLTTAGTMQITITTGSQIIQASRLTNKYVWDYSTPSVRYAANFFVAGGVTTTTLAGVAITGTAGEFTCTASSFVPNDAVVVSGTLTGTGTISGYVDPTTYYIIVANGTTEFQLSATPEGAPITTTVGTTTGLTFTIPSSVTAKSGAEIDTWSNGTGNLALAEVSDYTS